MYVPSTARAPVEQAAEVQVYKNRFMTLYDDEVRFANGRAGRYWRLVYGDGLPGAAVLPVCGDRVALVCVWRYAISGWEWAVPRGYAHTADPAQTACAELAEEIGVSPLELIPLGTVHPDSGHITSAVHLYAARISPDAVTEPADTEEVAGVQWITARELRQMIASGQITDGFTLAAVCQALCRGLLELYPVRQLETGLTCGGKIFPGLTCIQRKT